MSAVVCCPDCGLEFRPTGSLYGICPGCLMQRLVTEEDLAAFRGGKLPWGLDDRDAGSAVMTRRRVDFRPPTVESLAPYFPELEILELVGAGGMSAVYKARQKALDRVVALKVLPQEVATAQGGTERFQREARTLARLNHPNIVALHEFGQVEPWCYFLMEFVEGPNLRQLMGDVPLPHADMLHCIQDVCDGLQYAHDQGVIHRDIKPENVLLDRQGRAKIADFGLAKLLDDPAESLTQTHQIVGTPHYIAPERLERRSDVDHRADLFSLGVLLYELLTGELPAGHFEPPSRKSGCDQRFDDVVLRALAKEPRRRFHHARDISSAVLAIASDGPDTVILPVASASPGRFAHWILSAASILIGFLAVACLIESVHWTMRQSRQGYAAASLFLFLLSCVLARINVSFSRSWRDLSAAQWLAAPILIGGYLLFGILFFLMPAAFTVSLASVPLLTEVEHWAMFGQPFREADRTSYFSNYWLRSLGIGAMASSAWTLLLARAITLRPDSCQMVLHPTSLDALKALAVYLVMLGIILMAVGTGLVAIALALP